MALSWSEFACPRLNSRLFSGPDKGVITKGVFSLEESLESLRSLDSLEMVGFSFVLQSLGVLYKNSRSSKFSRISRISRKWTFLKRPLFQKTPFSEPDFQEIGDFDFSLGSERSQVECWICDPATLAQVSKQTQQGVFIEKGPFFHGKGASQRGDGGDSGGGFGGRVFT